MVARLCSATFCGIEALVVEVEVDVARRGFSGTILVGLPDAAVKESLERVRTALQNSGYQYPRFKTVINLAPADLRKEGPAFDLPVCLGILLASGDVVSDIVQHYLVAGELSLDGRIRPIHGVLSAAMLARRSGLRGVLVPKENAPEAAVVDGIEVIPVSTLTEAIGFLTEQLPLEPATIDLDRVFAEAASYDCDFADVRGQEHVKRAIKIAAAGAHNILMIGPSDGLILDGGESAIAVEKPRHGARKVASGRSSLPIHATQRRRAAKVPTVVGGGMTVQNGRSVAP